MSARHSGVAVAPAWAGAEPPAPPISLHVTAHGRGPDLVLLHGWGFDGGVWGDCGARLGSRFRVHRVDLPGHGRSAAAAFGRLPAVAEQVARVIPPGSTVCGWSLGGLVALQIALMDSHHVARLVLLGATPCFVERDDWAAGMPARPFHAFRAGFAVDRQQALRRFAGLVAAGSTDPRQRLRQLASMTTAAGPDATGLDAALDALLETDLRAALGSRSPPALVIHGSRDGLVPVAAAQWLHSQLGAGQPGSGGAGLEVLPFAGHAPFLDAPARVADCIADWHG